MGGGPSVHLPWIAIFYAVIWILLLVVEENRPLIVRMKNCSLTSD